MVRDADGIEAEYKRQATVCDDILNFFDGSLRFNTKNFFQRSKVNCGYRARLLRIVSPKSITVTRTMFRVVSHRPGSHTSTMAVLMIDANDFLLSRRMP